MASHQDNNVTAIPEGGSSSVEATAGPEKLKEGKKKKEKVPGVSIVQLFRFGTALDGLLVGVGIVCGIGQGLLPPINMLVLGNTINTLGSGLTSDALNNVIYQFLYIAAAAFVAGGVGAWVLELAAERQIYQLKLHYMKSLMSQEIAHFDVIDAGTLSAKIEQACVLIRDGIGLKMGQTFMFIAQFFGGYVVGLVKGWKLALVLSSVVPILGGVTAVFMMNLQKATQKSRAAYEKAGSTAEEAFPSMRTILAFNAQPRIIALYDKHLEETAKADNVANMIKGISGGVLFMVIFMSYSLGWYYGSRLVADRIQFHLDYDYGGTVITVFYSILTASFSLGQIFPTATATTLAMQAAYDVHQMIDRRSLVNPYATEGVKVTDRLQGKIEFRNVCFAYPTRPDKLVLQDLSFVIKPGSSVALVGPSGCGKSSIIGLLQRFYIPTSGEILIDDVPIEDYNIQSLRSRMALVPQEPRLFANTVMNNIMIGNPGRTEQQAIESAFQMNAKFVENFPDKWDTHVGHGGSALSGGQRQRIMLARAHLRKSDIIFFDESTSALDNESEKIVQKSLEDLLKIQQVTAITIAHRLSTLKNFVTDIIILGSIGTEGSTLLERGPWDELMQIPNGIFRALVEAQSGAPEKQ